jgi:hypothetical protein
MSGFAAIVLVCLVGTPVQDCDENKALVLRSTHVNNELGCSSGWQEIIARGGLQESLKGGNYIKTLCRREKGDQ